jgi:hypothetical protein
MVGLLEGEQVPLLVYLGEKELVEDTSLETLWREDKIK